MSTYKKTRRNSVYDDPRWKERRIEILEIDGYKCKRCGLNNDLEVHHLIYRVDKEIWEYSDQELFTLCSNCHNEFHAIKNELNKHLAELGRNWCYGLANERAEYRDAEAVLKFMAELGLMESKMYARSCIAAGHVMDGAEL